MVHLSWLDLGEDQFAAYGYASNEEWPTEIKVQHTINLQKYAQDYMKNREVGAESKNEIPSHDPAVLVIKFINHHLTN